MLFRQVDLYFKYANDFFLKPEIKMTSDTWSKLKTERVSIGNYKASKVFALIDNVFTWYEVQLISQLQLQKKSLLRNYSVTKREQLKKWLDDERLEVVISVKWFETSKNELTKPFIEVEADFLGSKNIMRFVSRQNFPNDLSLLKEWVERNIDKLL